MRRTRKFFASALFLIFSGLAHTAAFADEIAVEERRFDFRKLSDEQKYWWLHGSLMTLTHAVSLYDQKKSECIASWWGDHREERQKLIDEKLAQYPSIDSPTTIVIGLVTKACGPLAPQTH